MTKLSIVIPLLNEIDFIDQLVESLTIYDGVAREILLTDGGSTDGTVERIKEIEKANPTVRYINNKEKYVSQAFNTAYAQAKGDYIGLLGAHASYSSNYFTEAVKHLDADECDAIGGILIHKGRTELAKTISKCMTSMFGVGNTSVRTLFKKKYVDSAAFAIYRKDIFEDVGLFDVDMVRNQDDEFHYRMVSKGYRILLNPEMESTYFVRDSLNGLWKQYFNYGLYKPLVFKKVKRSWRLRHFAPLVLLMVLLSTPLGLLHHIFFIGPSIYLLMLVAFSIQVSTGVRSFIHALLVFPTLHLSYGAGMLRGLSNMLFSFQNYK